MCRTAHCACLSPPVRASHTLLECAKRRRANVRDYTPEAMALLRANLKERREKAEQLSRIAAALEVQKEMSRLKRLERFATLQSQAIALATRVTEGRVAAERSFTAAGLPATLGDSVAAVWAALPALLGDALTLAEDDYNSWRVEASAAKKRFKTTHCHALLRAVVALATELRAQPAAAAALADDTDLIDALRLLDEREAELAEAAAGAKAALAEELNDDV